ncbi:5-(carboxyamino)imidazole ribonucleotide synthase [Castellaniella caeni]|uniref:5-(carboxyamino)imidazole ribonucleotide synthase n=1 Tax=Castellaniella caeni TaxID=266123 RepID=UPI000A06E64E|nr:5-(carboxyamino)imidazole ribonucleotide synthase [Castellaniella caeni]
MSHPANHGAQQAASRGQAVEATVVRLPLAPAAPGSWLGVLGGGQLGRMFCHTAQALGYHVAVLDPAESSPAGMVADRHLRAAYDDPRALDALAQLCVAVTTEFENVPADSLRRLAAAGCLTTPAGDSVAIAQDRLAEKSYLQASGVPVAAHAAVRVLADLDACDETLFPGVLKTNRLGYDGKGQARVASRAEARTAFESLQGVPCILEALQPLAYEISVIVARGLDGQTVTYPPSRNAHLNGILALSVVDGSVPASVADVARQHALQVAEHLDYHGVLCVEFFVLRDGRVLANEMAPRPHNSGHYTQDGCLVSQFEQQARVMARLPLGDSDTLCPAAMLNLLGDLWFDAQGRRREPDWAGVLAVPGTRLHLYAKADARPARKMGHVNVLAPTAAELHARIAQVNAVLGLPDA